MPKLNKVDCSIELGPSNTRLKEYGARYRDGHVECFLVAPDTKVPFTIHLQSEAYIAPGLAVFVFMDGEYQCNRNRIGLKMPGDGVPSSEYQAEFRLRQKEQKTGAGVFVVREWTFDKLDRVAADKAPTLNPQFLNNVGTIEIVLLRCKASDNDLPPPRAVRSGQEKAPPSNSKDKDLASKHKDSKQPAKPASNPPKPPASQASGLGGMFGLFDGALHGCCDRNDFDASAEGSSALQANLDGTAPSPEFFENQWTDGTDDRKDKSIRYDDLNDPRYGQDWPPKDDHDERGSPSRGRSGNQRAFWSSPRPSLRQSQGQGMLYDNTNRSLELRQVADQIDRLERRLKCFLQERRYVSDLQRKEAEQDLWTIRELQQLLDEPPVLGKFPEWLKEALIDIEVMRQYTQGLDRHYDAPEFYSGVLNQLAMQQLNTTRDLRLRKLYQPTVDDCALLAQLFRERIENMEAFLKRMRSPAVDAEDLLSRIKQVRKERDNTITLARKMNRPRYAKSPPGDPYTRQRFDHAQPRTRNFDDRRFDATPAAGGTWPHNRLDSTNEQARAGPGFQSLGEGMWDSKDRTGHDSTKRERCRSGDRWPTGGHDWTRNDAGSKHSERGQGSRQARSVQSYGQRSARNDGQGNSKSQSPRDQGFHLPDNRSHSGSRKAASQQSAGNNQSTRGSNHHASNNDNGVGAWDPFNQHTQDANNNDNNWATNNDNNWATNNDNNNNAGNGWPAQAVSRARSHASFAAAPSDPDVASACVKDYWKDWSKPFSRSNAPDSGNKPVPPRREAYTYPAGPLPSVPAEKVKDASHGISKGRGADYSHKCRQPIYLDNMEAPYAVFSFKYRSKAALEKILKVKLDEVDIKKVEEQAERDMLSCMPKDQLVEELMKKRASRAVKSGGGSVQGNEQAAAWNDNSAQRAADIPGWSTQSNQNNGNWQQDQQGSVRSKTTVWKPDNGQQNDANPTWNDHNQSNSQAGGWNDNGNGGGVAW